ncbi:hypothetical protein [Dickeya oryzae]|uniref:Uncharacterized protein n=1 Tax=Dickeya oryzae TaxID=1240404 RepID=A0AB39ID94_9GAMM|nr:hypothetical protein [Dickeya oryzae]MBP2844072.1 hypothetical protein [Dickeya oryzae]MCA6993648.1 hypothetical protein [Dickeya oryzae]
MEMLKQANELIASPIWGVLVSIFLWIARFLFTWLTTTPKDKEDLLVIKGIKPWLLRLSGQFAKNESFKPLSNIDYSGFAIFTVFMVFLLMPFSYTLYKHVILIPTGWADLITEKDGKGKNKEAFLLSFDNATNIPGDNEWVIDVKTCSSDLYDNISKKLKISRDLVSLLCERIGRESFKDEANRMINKSEKERMAASIAFLVFFSFFIYVELGMFSDIYVRRKIAMHREEAKRKAYEYLT